MENQSQEQAWLVDLTSWFPVALMAGCPLHYGNHQEGILKEFAKGVGADEGKHSKPSYPGATGTNCVPKWKDHVH